MNYCGFVDVWLMEAVLLIRILACVLAVLTCISPFIMGKITVLQKNSLLTKMISSFLFLFTGISALIYVNASIYSVLIVLGLAFGVVGDFLLDYKNSKYFFIGVLAFATNHFFYIYCYLFVCKPAEKFDYKFNAILVAGIAVMSVLILKINKIHFKKGERLIIPYCFVLLFSFILVINRGFQAFFAGNIALAVSLICAASLFITSDSALAMVKFGDPPLKSVWKIINPFYFCAQAAFALSILFFE